jgi:restriction endonuclease
MRSLLYYSGCVKFIICFPDESVKSGNKLLGLKSMEHFNLNKHTNYVVWFPSK